MCNYTKCIQMQDYHHKLLITLLFISQINSNKTIEISLVYRTNRIPFLLHFINTCRDQKWNTMMRNCFGKKHKKIDTLEQQKIHVRIMTFYNLYT